MFQQQQQQQQQQQPEDVGIGFPAACHEADDVSTKI